MIFATEKWTPPPTTEPRPGGPRRIATTTFAVLVIGLLALAGCDRSPTLDTASPTTLEASANEVRATLPPERQQRFDEALEQVREAKVDVDGWTAEQVIAEADVMQRAAEERELARLEKQAAAHRAARAELDKLVLEEPRLILRQTSTEESANVQVRVKNTTSYDISRVTFAAELVSDGTEAPWAEQRVVHEADLAPGEEQTWTIAPGSQWFAAAAEAPEDARVQLRVIELEGEEGQSLAAERFGPDDQARLAKLRQRHQSDDASNGSA